MLLNDPTYLEAARKLAERAIQDGGLTDESRMSRAFRTSLSRQPTAVEMAVLVKTLQRRRSHFQKDPERAKSLISVGDSAYDKTIDELELASWTSVMSLILNLDETITKG